MGASNGMVMHAVLFIANADKGVVQFAPFIVYAHDSRFAHFFSPFVGRVSSAHNIFGSADIPLSE